jgi:hypothetical protein
LFFLLTRSYALLVAPYQNKWPLIVLLQGLIGFSLVLRYYPDFITPGLKMRETASRFFRP